MSERREHLFTDDPQEGASLGLLALMTGISEGYWCAGWMMGLERACWAAREAPERDHDYGMGSITQRQARLLRDLSDEAGGWWVYSDKRGPLFVSLDDYRASLATPA